MIQFEMVGTSGKRFLNNAHVQKIAGKRANVGWQLSELIITLDFGAEI